MPIMETLFTSIIGITTVILILAVIAVLIILVSKVIRTMEKSSSKGEAAPVASTASEPKGVPMPQGMMQGELELVNTDEKTAAVIMAIVSNQTDIPLNRLSFKSIKLMEE